MTVHLLCGLNGAGKTTHARRLAAEHGGVHFHLDRWMLQLYPHVRYDADEYGLHAEQCKLLIWSVAKQVLALGHDVILDWNGWSRERRAVWRDLARAAGYPVTLHYIQTPVAVAIERVEARNDASDTGAHRLDAAGVRQLAALFEEPTETEDIPLVLVNGVVNAS